MWTTLDGYRLRLPRSGNTLITAKSPGTGRQASLRRPAGRLDRSSVAFIGRVVRSSTRIGALRETWSDRRYPVFTADVNGRHYQTITGPSATPGELVILAVRPEVRRFSGELSDGRGHRIVQDSIYDWLLGQGLRDSRRLAAARQDAGEGIRDNRGQLPGLAGPPFANEPDISYIAAIGPRGTPRRVNVEIDTDPQNSRDHERRLIDNDPDSMHVFLRVHPITGRVLSRRVYDPDLHRGVRRAFPERPSLSLPVAFRRPGDPPPPSQVPIPRLQVRPIQRGQPWSWLVSSSGRLRQPRLIRVTSANIPRSAVPASPRPRGRQGQQVGLFDPARVPPRQGAGPVVLPPIPPRFRPPQQSLFPPTPGRPSREFEGFF
jgi:hypothetical protein